MIFGEGWIDSSSVEYNIPIIFSEYLQCLAMLHTLSTALSDQFHGRQSCWFTAGFAGDRTCHKRTDPMK